MKNLILALTITAASFTANAEAKSKSINEYCAEFSSMAERVMRGRQDGALMSKQYRDAKGNERMVLLVEWAYSTPIFNTEPYKRKAVTDFSNQVFLACIKA